jgi:hypothetical protein
VRAARHRGHRLQRKNAPYRSGKGDWIKVKTKAWREANRDRGELFNQR